MRSLKHVTGQCILGDISPPKRPARLVQFNCQVDRMGAAAPGTTVVRKAGSLTRRDCATWPDAANETCTFTDAPCIRPRDRKSQGFFVPVPTAASRYRVRSFSASSISFALVPPNSFA